MPVPVPPPTTYGLFPSLDVSQVDAARTSSWYPQLRHVSIPSTIIDLDSIGEREAFLEWLDADSIFLPQDSGAPAPPRGRSASISSVASSSSTSSSSSSGPPPVYRLPNLNAAIREAIQKYGGAVFPKLNWTSPKDAAFILPQGSNGPLYCTSPADVYLLLKSSDFINHDIDPQRVYADCQDIGDHAEVRVELVLKKHVQLDPAREFRCFVRGDVLIGVTQRDANYYEHLQSADTQQEICDTIRAFWEDELLRVYERGGDYVFDLHLSSSLSSAILVDIQPYRPSTDPLLFTYPELLSIITTSTSSAMSERRRLPILKVVDSAAHPQASRAAPAYGANMMPVEMIEMSQGRTVEGFREVWEDAVGRGMTE